MTLDERNALAAIAERHIPALEGRGGLDERKSDSLDFFETAVWSLEAALREAYELGKVEGRKASE